jgi:hypothetical protein
MINWERRRDASAFCISSSQYNGNIDKYEIRPSETHGKAGGILQSSSQYNGNNDELETTPRRVGFLQQ